MRLLLTLLIFVSFQIVQGQKTILHAGKLIDGFNAKALTEQTIVIEGGKITSVSAGYTPGESGDVVIDLKDKTVTPGLIDMHVHIEGETSPDRYLKRFTQNPADVAYDAAIYARKSLMAGFTSVRDMGGSGVNISLRNAINKGKVVGPRIITAGKALSITGGHGDPTNGYRRDLMGDPGPKEGVVNSEEDAKKAVRWRYKNGADWIKITATGGVLSVAKDGSGPHFKENEIASIVSAAKDLGYDVAAHAHGAEGMKRAVRAGVKTIEHGTMMDDETMDLMIKNNCYLIPTISAGKYVAQKAQENPRYFPPVVAQKAIAIGPQIQETFGRAYRKGVLIGFGTDAAVFPHGDNWKELVYMNEAGMPAMETIQTATSVNARILRMEDKIGSIKSGLEADIIAIDGDPLEDLSAFGSVSFVMKAGEVFKNSN